LRGGRRGKAAVEPLGDYGMEQTGRAHASSAHQRKLGRLARPTFRQSGQALHRYGEPVGIRTRLRTACAVGFFTQSTADFANGMCRLLFFCERNAAAVVISPARKVAAHLAPTWAPSLAVPKIG
jgi:hypothetical protein